jgi:NDP-sugar pyrophosphorylase family protein
VIAYLLCAGFGTRMRPLTNETPKSLARVAGSPILDYLLDELRPWSELDAIHVAVNHRDADAFRAWAAVHRPDLSDEGIDLHVHDDGVTAPDEQLGSMGDLNFLLDEVGLPDDGALVSGGDSLYRFPLPPILNAYRGRTNQALALHEPDPERRAHSSVLILDGPAVTEVVTDPSAPDSTRICPSWLLLSADALRAVSAYLEDGQPDDEIGAFCDHLAHTQSLRAHRLPERTNLRLHCNTIDDLERARRIFRDEPRHRLGPDAVRECLR